MKKFFIKSTVFLFFISSFLLLSVFFLIDKTNAQRKTCPDYCEDNTYYYAGTYVLREDNCKYERVHCEGGCDEKGIYCATVVPERKLSDVQKDQASSPADLTVTPERDIKVLDQRALQKEELVPEKQITDNVRVVVEERRLGEGVKEEKENENIGEEKETCINKIFFDFNREISLITEKYIKSDEKIKSINLVMKENVPYYEITKVKEKKIFGIFPVQKEEKIMVDIKFLEKEVSPDNNKKKIGESCKTGECYPVGFACKNIGKINSSDLLRCHGNYIKKHLYAKECSGQDSCKLDCSKFDHPCEKNVGLGCYISYGAKSKGICLPHDYVQEDKDILNKNLSKIPDIFCKSLPSSWDKKWPESFTYSSKKNEKDLTFTCGQVKKASIEHTNCKGPFCYMELPAFCYPKFSYNFYTGEFKYLGEGGKCFFAWDDPKNGVQLEVAKAEDNPYQQTIKEYNSKDIFWYYWE